MSLAAYRAKRDFQITREPRGRASTRGRALAFVVQKHAARSLHYDFRLEHGGVLWSWAVPKGPSLEPGARRLAVEVEDHPIEYGDFEGEIPKGQYGAGKVEIWDRGTWIPEGNPAAGHRDGHLDFSLVGGKLRGRFALVRTRANPASKSGKAAWLLIKRNDGRVQPAGDPHAGRKARMPAMLPPMLATLVARAPEGDDWIHEIKYDGYRMLARIDRGRARLYSRNGRDWTRYFPGVARDLAALEVDRAWLDGEMVVVDAEGRTSFQALQNALTGKGSREFSYFAFDLPYLRRRRPARRAAGGAQAVAARRGRRRHGRHSRRAGSARRRRRVPSPGMHFGAGRNRRQARRLAVCGRQAFARLGKGEVHATAGNGDRRVYGAAGFEDRVWRLAARRL